MAYFRTGGAGIPAALKSGMNNVLNKKFGTTGQDYDPNGWPDDVNLMGALEIKTATGAIASFSDGADDVPIDDGIFNIDYTGTAVSEMTIRQTGKNLLDDTKRYTTQGNTVVSMNATGWNDKAVSLPAGDYYIKSFMNQGASVVIVQIGFANSTTTIKTISGGAGSFNLSEKTDIWIKLNIYPGTPADLLGVMLTQGTTVSDYEPFISVSDKTVDFDGSIYGGSYNSVTGVLTSTKASDGSDLAEPVETNIGATAINSLFGNNNIYCDTGDTTIDYRSSGTETIIQPTLVTKQITENGTYNAADDDADGFSSVTVAVPGSQPLVPTFSETLIADNTTLASSFTLSESYNNYDLVKIVWYESASSSGYLYTTPDILDEIFTVSTRVCINKPDTNTYVCYSKNGLTWTRTNQRNIDVHEIYGVTFTNCSMTATDLYKRGAVTTSSASITSQTSLKEFDLIMMSSIHNADGSETMPCTWLYTYPNDLIINAFSGIGCPYVLEEYSTYNENFRMTEYGMTSARYFMVQGIKLTAI